MEGFTSDTKNVSVPEAPATGATVIESAFARKTDTEESSGS